MSTFDDFTNHKADQARGKFIRAKYDEITTDEWIAFVNVLDAVIEHDSEAAARYRDLCD